MHEWFVFFCFVFWFLFLEELNKTVNIYFVPRQNVKNLKQNGVSNGFHTCCDDVAILPKIVTIDLVIFTKLKSNIVNGRRMSRQWLGWPNSGDPYIKWCKIFKTNTFESNQCFDIYIGILFVICDKNLKSIGLNYFLKIWNKNTYTVLQIKMKF